LLGSGRLTLLGVRVTTVTMETQRWALCIVVELCCYATSTCRCRSLRFFKNTAIRSVCSCCAKTFHDVYCTSSAVFNSVIAFHLKRKI